jgi:hypothetical protein
MSYIKIFLITISIFSVSCSDKNSNEEINNKYHKEKEMNTIKKQEVMQKRQNEIYLQFGNDLNNIKAGEKFDLVFTPILKKNKNALVLLETIHERRAHLIFVSEDLEYFNHIHPTKETNGVYSVETNLPYGGKYKLFAEYKPADEEKITEVIEIIVDGDQKPEKSYNSENKFYMGKEYSVKLLNTNNLIAGKDSRIIAEFYKDGRELNINKLENYLGEKSHAVAINLRDKNFMHIHPMIIDDKLNLHLNFDEADLYRLWLQFKINGKVYTSDFVVKASHSEKMETITNQHKHH